MPVLLDIKGPVATVTLNRPDQRNAVNVAVCEAMRDRFDQIEASPDVRVTILQGAGGLFCAGMDLRAFAAGDGNRILFGQHGFAGFVKRRRSKPVIAAIEGAALAGGFEVMLACDLVIAAQDARFGLPEAKLGLFAGAGGVLRLAHRIPRVKANEILLTGKLFDAATADDLGLLNAVVAPGTAYEHAQTLAADIAASAPLSVTTSLALSDAAFGLAEDWDANDRQIADIARSADSQEGARAFIEKRKPVWSGQKVGET